ncbi:post-GPI attachment to proteins factor 2-like [Schistocerca piceifrons]|uniref:post-GPI attachment to proteins factor 2-like n=1 Tax=Schistocerca piceifrons TaxID=274613 RepID=UPI001F5EDEF1|nr:post-GPI attachment to proteins factor 2-like [Schistocerca piceifrons]XP_049764302.1 post-GPI attachment to proteins factor 2-like [Schistocerca cancellata]XP_049788771.1 post-GPI attachment to proteins factor 2-like isoform X1 [Schistocerca nitens]XP_049939479.1 post-GPI attachment to proteins factor 2-like [Schistocerca serialis cubense]
MSTTITLGQDYLPLHHKKKGYTLSIPFGKVAWVTVSLPLTSFIFCVIWSILFNFERSTYTHCQVKNYLPSISAAIGVFTPQRYVWRTAIAVHALPRLLVAKMYHRYYQSVLYPGIHFLAAIACWLNVMENLALIGLTFISSAENYAIHEKCFITFMITSELYMLLTCYLLRKFRRFPPDNVESRSLKIKHQLLVINLTSFAMAGYFFKRHNWYCEPGVYSIFAFFEYIVVLTNMAFHMTAFWDFHDRSLEVGPLGFGHS